MPKEYCDPTFASNPRFSYLPSSDRYIFQKKQPTHGIVVIGTGVNGLEHISVTALEGRAIIVGIYDPNPLSQVKEDFAVKLIGNCHQTFQSTLA